ncbi:MAG: glycosyltransferase family 8 protein [Bacteroidales bacterium]|nr:glycosyltransferase family 8 protein [Bacteroidales bacterium]
MTINVLCASDNNYVAQCSVMLCSLLDNAKSANIVIHIIDGGITEENKKTLAELVALRGAKLSLYSFSYDQCNLFGTGLCAATSIVTYFRLFVASIIKDSNVDKILYLDCDIVVKSDVSELFYIDMQNYGLAAVRDVGMPYNSKHQYSLRCNYKEKYFNAGVLMINLDYWRNNEIERKLIEFASSNKELLFADQDVLNAVLRNQWLELAPYWNRFSLVKYKDVYFRNKADELQYIYQPKIIHYASPTSRPWMKMCFVKFQKEYDTYLKLTPWAGTKKVEVERFARYKSIFMVNYSNFIFRSPLLIRIVLTSMSDVLLVFYHLLRHFSLRYFSPHR